MVALDGKTLRRSVDRGGARRYVQVDYRMSSGIAREEGLQTLLPAGTGHGVRPVRFEQATCAVEDVELGDAQDVGLIVVDQVAVDDDMCSAGTYRPATRTWRKPASGRRPSALQ